jgi:hypothetical protein
MYSSTCTWYGGVERNGYDTVRSTVHLGVQRRDIDF